MKPSYVSTDKNDGSRLATVIAMLSREELEEIILMRARTDHVFALGILAEHDDAPANRVGAELRASIRAELERFCNSWGLIEYRDSFAAAKVFDRLFDQIDSHRSHGAYRAAFDITAAIIEEAGVAITHTDDSAGEVGGVVHRAIEVLRTIAEVEIDVELRHDIVSYVEKTVVSEQFPDVADWRIDLWRLALAVVRSGEEYERLRTALQDALPPEASEHGFARNYMREQLLVLMTQLMERFGDRDQADTIRQDNRHLTSFREELLTRAWSGNNYDEAVCLAEEGIAHDAHLPGLVKKWRTWALQTYQAAEQNEEARRIARDLVVSGDPEYLATYRDLVPADAWPEAREELIEEITSTPGYTHRVLPEIYVLEELWSRLMELVETESRYVTEYGDQLYPHFPERVRAVWSSLIMQEARSTNDRRGYRRLSGSIERYAAVTGVSAAVEIRDAILLEFPHRPAMRDELSTPYRAPLTHRETPRSGPQRHDR